MARSVSTSQGPGFFSRPDKSAIRSTGALMGALGIHKSPPSTTDAAQCSLDAAHVRSIVRELHPTSLLFHPLGDIRSGGHGNCINWHNYRSARERRELG